MKRARCQQTCSATPPPSKRCKRIAEDGCDRTSQRASKPAPPRSTFNTTFHETLDKRQLIEEWAQSCATVTAMPSTRPPSAASNESGRRASKLGYRRRSQSPIKKTSTQYRTRNMSDARVFVDHFPCPPPHILDSLEAIFKVSDLDDIGQASDTEFAEVSKDYRSKSVDMAKECAGEGQWKSCLFVSLLEPIQKLCKGLKLSASEKPWNPELRPLPRSWEDMFGSVPPLGNVSSTDTTVSGPSYAPSEAASDITTDDPNRVSVPKPDITLGLAHDSFTQIQGKILWQLQDNDRLLSEPHQSGVGLHFPFLVVEAKGLAPGSNMVGAQNQAAVDGACALKILHDLHGNSGVNDTKRDLFFSLLTEGPIHELWVHYPVEEAFHMTALKTWRTTSPRRAAELVRSLYQILQWGNGAFRDGITNELDCIANLLREQRSGL